MLFKNINQKNSGCLNKGRATVLFFIPRCIHCVNMRSDWEKMKESLKRRKKNCNIYEINGENLHEINTPLKNNIDGFPTIMNIENGSMKESFMGERTMENMLGFVESNENTSLPINMRRKRKRKTGKRRGSQRGGKKHNKTSKKRKTRSRR